MKKSKGEEKTKRIIDKEKIQECKDKSNKNKKAKSPDIAINLFFVFDFNEYE